MRPEVFQKEFNKILTSSFLGQKDEPPKELKLSETEMFRLWNVLGEELGIDLSLASEDERQLLFDACQNGRRLSPADFSSLLWLVYYGDASVN
jgi:hypothetical protein